MLLLSSCSASFGDLFYDAHKLLAPKILSQWKLIYCKDRTVFFSCSFMTTWIVRSSYVHTARFVSHDAPHDGDSFINFFLSFYVWMDVRWLIECTMHSESKSKFTCGNIWTFFCYLHTMHTINQTQETVDISKESFSLF